MLDHSFTYNDIDMREHFGLIVSSVDDYLIPQKRERKIEIPHRDGAYDCDTRRDDETYKERPLIIHCSSVHLFTRADVRELTYVLSRKGKIVLWNEPDKYYIGSIYNPDYIERVVRHMKKFDITFTCEPFAYGKQVTVNWEETNYKPQYNGTARTPTYIALRNNSANAKAVGVTIRIRERS